MPGRRFVWLSNSSFCARSLLALLPPGLEQVVLETAAAIAVGYTSSAIAQRLIETIPAQVWRSPVEHSANGT